jgi:hypothetical protein
LPFDTRPAGATASARRTLPWVCISPQIKASHHRLPGTHDLHVVRAKTQRTPRGLPRRRERLGQQPAQALSCRDTSLVRASQPSQFRVHTIAHLRFESVDLSHHSSAALEQVVDITAMTFSTSENPDPDALMPTSVARGPRIAPPTSPAIGEPEPYDRVDQFPLTDSSFFREPIETVPDSTEVRLTPLGSR